MATARRTVGNRDFRDGQSRLAALHPQPRKQIQTAYMNSAGCLTVRTPCAKPCNRDGNRHPLHQELHARQALDIQSAYRAEAARQTTTSATGDCLCAAMEQSTATSSAILEAITGRYARRHMEARVSIALLHAHLLRSRVHTAGIIPSTEMKAVTMARRMDRFARRHMEAVAATVLLHVRQ